MEIMERKLQKKSINDKIGDIKTTRWTYFFLENAKTTDSVPNHYFDLKTKEQ